MPQLDRVAVCKVIWTITTTTTTTTTTMTVTRATLRKMLNGRCNWKRQNAQTDRARRKLTITYITVELCLKMVERKDARKMTE